MLTDGYTDQPPPSHIAATSTVPVSPPPVAVAHPATGVGLWPLVLVASMLLLAGLALLGARWRRT